MAARDRLEQFRYWCELSGKCSVGLFLTEKASRTPFSGLHLHLNCFSLPDGTPIRIAGRKSARKRLRPTNPKVKTVRITGTIVTTDASAPKPSLTDKLRLRQR